MKAPAGSPRRRAGAASCRACAAALLLAAGVTACGGETLEGGAHSSASSVETFEEDIDAGRSTGQGASGDGTGAERAISPAEDSPVSVSADSLPEPEARPVPSADRYALDPHPGHCEAAITMYYYDRDEKRCKAFSWGGCGGVVPFETLEECESGLHLLVDP